MKAKTIFKVSWNVLVRASYDDGAVMETKEAFRETKEDAYDLVRKLEAAHLLLLLPRKINTSVTEVEVL